MVGAPQTVTIPDLWISAEKMLSSQTPALGKEELCPELRKMDQREYFVLGLENANWEYTTGYAKLWNLMRTFMAIVGVWEGVLASFQKQDPIYQQASLAMISVLMGATLIKIGRKPSENLLKYQLTLNEARLQRLEEKCQTLDQFLANPEVSEKANRQMQLARDYFSSFLPQQS